jgi:hypothetical protein
MLQPLARVLYAVEQFSDVSGQTVGVTGQGPIGLLLSHVFKARGGARVTGVDPVNRSDVASAFGVDEMVTARAERWAGSLPDADRPSVVWRRWATRSRRSSRHWTPCVWRSGLLLRRPRRHVLPVRHDDRGSAGRAASGCRAPGGAGPAY